MRDEGWILQNTLLPTRVIDVRLDSSQKPRVVDTHSSKGVYATLSYCWGCQKNTTLRQDNISQLQREIDAENLPQTIRDAVETTRKMSIRYLWVDALCIVQDDEIEKAKEIARMQDVYSCSTVTIIASSASGADEGFLSLSEDKYLNPYRRLVVIPVRIFPRQIRPHELGGSQRRNLSLGEHGTHLPQGTDNTRAASGPKKANFHPARPHDDMELSALSPNSYLWRIHAFALLAWKLQW